MGRRSEIIRVNATLRVPSDTAAAKKEDDAPKKRN